MGATSLMAANKLNAKKVLTYAIADKGNKIMKTIKIYIFIIFINAYSNH